MKNETKQLYTAYVNRIAQLNGVTTEDVKEGFNVTPSIEQKLQEKVQLSSEFLQWINVINTDKLEGELVGLGVSIPVASSTDTSQGAERKTRDILNLTGRKFRCEQVNFDTHITYAKLDAWAKFPDFQAKLASQTQKAIALSLIMMGFNGTTRAETSNLSSNPLLQDVKKGWLQQMRDDVPTQVMNGADNGNKIKVGKNQGKHNGYENLDALVVDAVNNIIDEVYAEDTDLVVICGRQLLGDKYFNIVNKDMNAQDELASQVLISQKQLGGLRAIRVPYFPKNAMLITRLDNLSIYQQEGSIRRFIINKPERNRIEDYLSENIDFKIEEYGCAALIENIVLEDATE
ncbi:major capsid protein [Pasteurellaceae bacterium Pebbles2]|nr:major capsid protein [Pasteurellaceae bacterium Pebbles2]